MRQYLKKLIKKEDGAVTAEFVVIVAGVAAMCVTVTTAMFKDLGTPLQKFLSGWTF